MKDLPLGSCAVTPQPCHMNIHCMYTCSSQTVITATAKLISPPTIPGEHPRIGALDVCPFVPVSNVTAEDCVECSQLFAQRLAEELTVPVYLYSDSQENQSRKTLPQIRKGEYEGLKEKVW